MSTVLQKKRAECAKLVEEQAPLLDASEITVKKIDLGNLAIPGYKKNYAVVVDSVISQEESDDLIRTVEMSAGAHGNHAVAPDEMKQGAGEPPNNGWQTAIVNAGRNHEVLAIDYRNSDCIIWDDKEVTTRLWHSVLQGEGMKEYFGVLDGEKYLLLMEQMLRGRAADGVFTAGLG